MKRAPACGPPPRVSDVPEATFQGEIVGRKQWTAYARIDGADALGSASKAVWVASPFYFSSCRHTLKRPRRQPPLRGLRRPKGC